MAKKSRTELRVVRHRRVRKRVEGTTARPRLAVYRSLKHISVQLIDDSKGHTVAAVSTLDKKLGAKATVEGAKQIGKEIGKRAADAGYKRVVFDRGGYRFHGMVAAIAEGARDAGLEF